MAPADVEPKLAATVRLTLAAAATLCGPAGPCVSLGPRDAALLAWLAIEGPTPRARLAGLLWPQRKPDAGRNNLRQRVFKLRQLAGAEVISGGTTLRLAPAVEHDLDDAESLLADVPDEIGGEFSGWLAQQRGRRRERVRRALVELIEMAEQARDFADALVHAKELLALEPLSEDAHRRAIRLHYLNDDRAAALLAFDACERMLKDEVGTGLSAETLALLKVMEAAAPAAAPARARAVPASVLRPPRLVGRSAEAAALRASWGAGAVVAVIGEAGLGKTRLLQEFIETQGGIARAAGRPGDAGVPFATLARLLRTLHEPERVAALTPQVRQQLARVLPDIDIDVRHAGEGQRLAMQRAVAAFLASRSELQGLVVDDLHFADEASLDMLRALIESAEPPLAWALAYRPAEAGSPVQALHDALAEAAHLVPVALQPLSLAAVAELVDSLSLPGVVGASLAPALLQRTGGNPLFVLETLKLAWADETLADASALPRPLSVARLIERRIAQLSPPALALARVAAIASVDFDIALAEQVLRASAMQFADAINELEAAQVLRGNAFAHDLVYDAVRASVPATLAAHTHAQVAQWLQQCKGEPARIARHWMQAGQSLAALPWLQQAADAAARALRFKEAAEFLRTKSRLEQEAGLADAAFKSLFGAAEYIMATGPGTELLHAQCDELDALAKTPLAQVRVGLMRAEGLLTLGLHAEAATEASAMLERCGELPEADRARLQARARMQLAGAWVYLNRTREAVPLLEAALAYLEARGEDEMLCWGCNMLALAWEHLGRPDRARPYHERHYALSLSLGQTVNAATGRINESRYRLHAGAAEHAEQMSSQALQLLASQDSAEQDTALGLSQRAACLCVLGRYDEALHAHALALEPIGRVSPLRQAISLLRLATVWRHLGQQARLSQCLTQVQALPHRITPVARAELARLQCEAARLLNGDIDAPQQAMRQVLDDIAPDTEHAVALPLRIALAGFEPLPQALSLLEAVAAEATERGYLGMALTAQVRMADLACDAQPTRAARAAGAALALHAQGWRSSHALPAELWLHTGRALAAAGLPDEAQHVWAEGQQWLLETAQHHVPEPFRESFLSRQPVNRELLALASRPGAD